MTAERFFIVPGSLLESPVSGNAIKLYGILSFEGPCPSHAQLARLSSLSASTVKRKLAELERFGAIEQEARYGAEGERLSNRYTLIRGDA